MRRHLSSATLKLFMHDRTHQTCLYSERKKNRKRSIGSNVSLKKKRKIMMMIEQLADKRGEREREKDRERKRMRERERVIVSERMTSLLCARIYFQNKCTFSSLSVMCLSSLFLHRFERAFALFFAYKYV